MQIVMLISRMWSWVYLTTVLTLCMTLNDVTTANQAALVGTVYCDTCFHGDFSESSHFISGALVVVECGDVGIQTSGGKPGFWEEVKTDEKGEFRVKLPFEATKHVSEIERCAVKLINSSEPDCAVAPTMIPSSIRLKMKTPENHVFSAGFFIFQPLEQPKKCQRESRNSNDEFGASTPFPSPVAGDMLDEKQTTIELDDLADINDPGVMYPPSQYLPPSLIPSIQFLPPPDSMFTTESQPPPPDSMFNLNFQPPPASMFNTTPLRTPPDSFNPFQPSPPSLIPQLFIPPPPLLPSFPFPPVDSQPDTIQSIPPPPSSMLSPVDPQPDVIQSMPPPPPSMFPPVYPQPDLIQSAPPPPIMPPSALLPPFPFQPSPGLPRMPPGTSSSHLKKILVP